MMSAGTASPSDTGSHSTVNLSVTGTESWHKLTTIPILKGLSHWRLRAYAIRFVEGLSDAESKEIEKRLPEGWAGFPGLVTLLWQAFGQRQTTRSA